MIKKETKKETCCSDEIFTHGKHHHKGDCGCHHGQSSSAIYGLGIFGALFYFLKGAATFTAVIVGIFKSIFWPAFVLFKVLTLLGL
jgi:hypothetical protein